MEARPHLSPAIVLADIVAMIADHWRSLLLVSVPMILLCAWTVAHASLAIDLSQDIEALEWPATLLDLVLFIILPTIWSVSISRIALMNDAGRARWLGLRWQRREWRVLWQSFIVTLMGLLMFVPVLFVAPIVASAIDWDLWGWFAGSAGGYWGSLAFMLIASSLFLFGFGRWGLSIVGPAVDQKVDMETAWRATIGNTIAVVGTMFLLLLPSTALQTYIDLHLPFSTGGFRTALLVGSTVCIAYYFGVQIFVLCAAYRRLIPPQRETTAAPQPADGKVTA